MKKVTGAVRESRAFEWVEGYRPLRIPSRDWALVRPFVFECAEHLGLDGGAGAVRVVRVLARLAVWAVREGLPLDPEVVLDPDSIGRFVAVGIADVRSRATYGAVLRQVGPLLTTRAPWEARPAPVARRQVAAPYTPRELDGLRTAALAQPTHRGGFGQPERCWRSGRAPGSTGVGSPKSRPTT